MRTLIVLFAMAILALPAGMKAAEPPVAWKALEGHADAVYCIDAAPNGKWFVSGGFDQTLKLWDAKTRQPVRSFSGHTKMVLAVSFSPDSKSIASGSLDNVVKIWPAELLPTGKPTPAESFTHNFAGHQSQIYGVAWSPDGKRVASCSFDKSIKIWEIATKRELRSIPVDVKDVVVYGVTFTADGKSLLACYSDGLIRQFEADTGKAQRQFSGPKGALYSMSLQKQGAFLAAAGLDKTIYVWKTGDGQVERSIPGHDDDIYRVQFNPAGTKLMSLGYSGQVKVWDASNGKSLLATKLPALLFGGCYSNDGREILAAASDQKIYAIELPPAAQ